MLLIESKLLASIPAGNNLALAMQYFCIHNRYLASAAGDWHIRGQYLLTAEEQQENGGSAQKSTQ